MPGQVLSLPTPSLEMLGTNFALNSPLVLPGCPYGSLCWYDVDLSHVL